MTPLNAALPSRPLRLRTGRLGLRGILFALMGVALAGAVVFAVWRDVGDIRLDLALREAAQPSPLARVVSGNCRSRAFLLQSCDVSLLVRDKQVEHRRTARFTFIEPHMSGSWTTVALLDPARPELPTTQLGLDRLTNRMLTAAGIAVFAPLFLFGGMAGLRDDLRLRRRLRALARQELRPVAARLERIDPGPVWWITPPGGPSIAWPMGGRDRPFLLDRERGLVLALQGTAGEAYPLDAKLRRVDLTREERRRALSLLPAQAE